MKRSFKLFSFILLVFGVMLPACANSAPTDPVQLDRLYRFIVSELVGPVTKRPELYVVRVERPSNSHDWPLDASQDLFRQCWFVQVGGTSDCTYQDLADSYEFQDATHLKDGHFTFAIISIANDYSQAVIRLDENFGPMAASGDLITLRQVDGQWAEESRESIFVT